MELGVVGLLAVLALVAVTVGLGGVWVRSRSRARKLADLRSMDGQRVRLGLTLVGKGFVMENTGVLRVGPSPDAVILEGRKIRSV